MKTSHPRDGSDMGGQTPAPPPDILEQVRAIVIDVLRPDLPHDAIHGGTCIIDDLGADSINTIEIIMAIEDRFGIEIGFEEGEAIVTIADAARLVPARGRVQ